MGKKNPYVFTIGFNKADPSHRAVVEILNEKGRGMAQYITEAVLAYHPSGEQTVGNKMDYDRIVKIVNEILDKRLNTYQSKEQFNIQNERENYSERLQDRLSITDSELKEIMDSIVSLRN